MFSNSNAHYKNSLSRFWLIQIMLTLLIPMNHGRGTGVVDIAQFIVKREGNSSKDCEEACKKEMLLTCHYFFHLEDSKTCLLSSTDHPVVATQARTIGIDPWSVQKFMKEKQKLVLSEIEEVHDLKNELSELKSRVQGLQDMKRRMSYLIDQLEVNSSPTGERAMRTLAARVVKLTEVTELLQSEMSKILDRRSSSSHEIKQLRLKDAKTEAELEQALGNIERLHAYISTLKRQDDVSHNELEKLMEKYDQIKNRMKWLKKRIDSPQSNPIIIKALHNQKLISETLKNMEEKVEMFDASQMKSDEMYDRLKGEVIQNEGERRSLLDVILSLKKEVQGLKADLKRIENPRSSANMQRLRTLTSLKGEVELLKRANEDLLKNLKLTKTDLKDLVTDIVNLKLDSQSNRAGITAVALAHRHTVQTFNDMNEEQRDLLEKIHTMEDVYRRILEVVHDVEIHQVKLKHEVTQLDNSLHKMSHSVGRLAEDRNAVLADQTSALGETLSKLSISNLEEEEPTPIKQEKESMKETAKHAEIPLKLVNLAGEEEQLTKNEQEEAEKEEIQKPKSELLSEKKLQEEEVKLNNELKAKNSLKMSDLIVAKQKLKNEEDRLLAEKEIEDQQRLALLAKKKLDEKEKILEKKIRDDEEMLEAKEQILAEKQLPKKNVFKELLKRKKKENKKTQEEKEEEKEKSAEKEEKEQEKLEEKMEQKLEEKKKLEEAEEKEEKKAEKKKEQMLANEEAKRSEKQLEKKKKLQKALSEEQNTAKKMPIIKKEAENKVKNPSKEVSKNGKKKNKKGRKKKSRKGRKRRRRRRKRKGKKGKKKP